jgi:glycosyltransferase involved in cell wall biosynthesis
MNPLVSVIIPLYNNEIYFPDCLKSILMQSYKNIEIIIIDDGSKDDSGKIADEFAKQDSRIKVIHKENEGVSKARNLGLQFSNGEYICFVDSDDILDQLFIEKLYNCITQYKCDIAICEMQFVTVSGDKRTITGGTNYRSQLIQIDSNYCFERGEQHLCACAALYNREVIGNIQFNEKIFIGEDALFHNQVMLNSKFVYFLSEKLYFYIMHDDSCFKRSYTSRRFTEINAWKEICSLFEKMPKAKLSASGEYCIRCISVYKEIIKLSDDIYKNDKQILINEMIKYRNYIKYCKLDLREAISLRFAAYMPRMYEHVYKLYFRKYKKKVEN